MARLLLTLLAALACSPARAQAIVTLWDPAYVAVRPGTSVELMVMAQVRPGYVVIANRSEDPELQPLTLRFRRAREVTVGAPRYPKAEDTPVDADRRVVPTHAGTLRIGVPITVSKQAAAGELTLKGELRYQACIERRCSATRTLAVNLTIDVLPARN